MTTPKALALRPCSSKWRHMRAAGSTGLRLSSLRIDNSTVAPLMGHSHLHTQAALVKTVSHTGQALGQSLFFPSCSAPKTCPPPNKIKHALPCARQPMKIFADARAWLMHGPPAPDAPLKEPGPGHRPRRASQQQRGREVGGVGQVPHLLPHLGAAIREQS
jgi:hypothetical protein